MLNCACDSHWAGIKWDYELHPEFMGLLIPTVWPSFKNPYIFVRDASLDSLVLTSSATNNPKISLWCCTCNHLTTFSHCYHPDTKCKLKHSFCTQFLLCLQSLSICTFYHSQSLLNWIGQSFGYYWINYGNDNILPRIRREGENL